MNAMSSLKETFLRGLAVAGLVTGMSTAQDAQAGTVDEALQRTNRMNLPTQSEPGEHVGIVHGGTEHDGQTERERVSVTEIPPTIMFHARENQRRILSNLIEQLQNEGFQFVTYEQWYRSLETGQPIERPVILTFDDLTMVRGSSNFRFYSEVVEILQAKGVPGVFGIITEPVVIGANGNTVQLTDQDDEMWRQVAAWVQSGTVELATHTQSHPNLNNGALTPNDLSREIGGSARLIQERTGQPVTTLITPYGSGVTQEGVIAPRVLEASAEAGIRFVVGIAGMREPVANTSQNGTAIYGVGRIMPDDNQDSTTLLTSLQAQVQRWDEMNSPE